jgi:hypothetical protein
MDPCYVLGPEISSPDEYQAGTLDIRVLGVNHPALLIFRFLTTEPLKKGFYSML